MQTIRVAVERRELVPQDCQGLLCLLGLDSFEKLLLSNGKLDRLERNRSGRGDEAKKLAPERTGREETHLQVDARIDGQTLK